MAIKLHRCYLVLFWAMWSLGTSVSCASEVDRPISLASFTENDVEVFIRLERDAAGNYLLSGIFTPPEGYHLYSKDIPLHGVDGLGRPTLLEFTSSSLAQATGELRESVKAQKPDFETRDLLVYPAGPVTLSLPIELPPGEGWINDELKITYMACSASQCKPPVEGKSVSVRIPGADSTGHR